MSHKQTAESFWSRVDVRSLDDCWHWTGATNNTGYGTAGWCGKTYVAHRIAAWILGFVEQIAAPTDREGTGFVLHACDNRLCCNPCHWDIGTYSENQLAAYRRGRRAPARGASHANAKLTTEQALNIRARYRAGATQVCLAAEHFVSQGAISGVVRRETYA